MAELANPARTVVSEAVVNPVIREESWGAFNDPAFFEPRFAAGTLHEGLRENLLDKPQFERPVPGPVMRYIAFYNEERRKYPENHALVGDLILKKQVVERQPWRKVTETEKESLDDGRRAYGR
jgi:hypothetical protein